MPLGRWRARWPNFLPKELACSHCGELVIDTQALDALQAQRERSGPIVVTSAYRCPIHNAMVGGAPLSSHKTGKAIDQALRRRHGAAAEADALAAGFKGIGRYRTFIHTDTGRKRSWGRWVS